MNNAQTKFPEYVEICYNSILNGCKLNATILEKKYKPCFKGKLYARYEDLKTHLHSMDRLVEKNTTCDFIMYKYYFVALTVALRRNINIQHTRKLFLDLWKEYNNDLIKELSLRWLISAADSLVDYGESDTQKSIAMLAVGLANTIKLVETERRLTNSTTAPLDTKNIKDHRLFDQVNIFSVEKGDLMFNMWKRFDAVIKLDNLSGSIFQEILKRLTIYDTTYKRFLNINKYKINKSA